MANKLLQTKRNKLELGIKPKDITPRQAELLSYVLQCWLSGFIPSIREIADEFDISSPNGVVCTLNYLRAAGYLEETGDTKSSLMLSDKAIELAI